jgi:hypothetical protein
MEVDLLQKASSMTILEDKPLAPIFLMAAHEIASRRKSPT